MKKEEKRKRAANDCVPEKKKKGASVDP